MHRIDSVCRDDINGRGPLFANLFFKYHDDDTTDVSEFTLCIMKVIKSTFGANGKRELLVEMIAEKSAEYNDD